MKTFTRWLLALLLVAAPTIAAVQTASANSELVPASRLVAPFITNETGRNTFLLLVNTSTIRLTDAAPGTSLGGVHVEFYDKTCSRNDIVVRLSERDMDQVNVTTTNFTGTSLKGYADIDVRSTAIYTDSQGAPSIQRNALMGTVLVSDSTNDFAFSYPMAASLGSAASGTSGDEIVRRNSSGAASRWTGRYEPYPSRVFVPVFFAEGTDAAGATVTGFLSVVTPADGNWHGAGGELVTPGSEAEAPGEAISVLSGSSPLTLGTLIFDGCENQGSANLSGHTIMDTLTNLFTAGVVGRSNWTAANCTAGTFPGLDELSSQPVGWMQITNTSTQCKGSSTGCGGDLNPPRGLVGLFFESSVGGSPSKKMADNSRLWGDPITGSRATASGAGCRFSTSTGGPGSATACTYHFNMTSQP